MGQLPLSVVLCGGRGSRLGGAVKPLLRRDDGVAILDAIRAVLAGHQVVLAVTERTRAAIVPREGERVSIDPGEGPLAAIREAAKLASAGGWLLAVPGDTPHPCRALVDRLEGARDARHHAVCVRAGGVLQPLWALYEVAPLLALALPERAGPQHALSMLTPKVIEEAELDPAERRAYAGVNTPDDARALGVRLT